VCCVRVKILDLKGGFILILFAKNGHFATLFRYFIYLRIELDGPGSNSSGYEIFCPSRPALGPTQPPTNEYRFFLAGKVRPGRAADHSPPSSAVVMEE